MNASLGGYPHKGPTVADTICMQIEAPTPRPRQVRPDAGISNRLEDVLMVALEKDREARFSNMTAFANALEGVDELAKEDAPRAADKPLFGDPTSTPYELREDTRRRPPVFAIATSVAVLCAGGFGLFLMTRQEPKDTQRRSTAPQQPPALASANNSDAGATDDATADSRVAPPPPVQTPVPPAPEPTAPPPTRPKEPGGVARIQSDPPGAKLFIGDRHLGKASTLIRRPDGTTATVTCSMSGYLNGSVKVSFRSEKPRTYTCRMTRCVTGLKNPFGECE